MKHEFRKGRTIKDKLLKEHLPEKKVEKVVDESMAPEVRAKVSKAAWLVWCGLDPKNPEPNVTMAD